LKTENDHVVSDSFIFDTHTLFHKNLGKERRQERNKKQKQTKQFQILDTDIFIITATTAEGGRKERKKERNESTNHPLSDPPDPAIAFCLVATQLTIFAFKSCSF